MQDLLQAAGGLGLFLLGVALLTDGLRGLAGNALERSLRRFTRSPLSGAVSGAVATALVGSSSATTVTAVGFAGAAILTFPQALGIVFGANIGTTLRGWLVALLGFRPDIGAIASLLVLTGALLRLLGRGRARHAGLAIAGFGLVFVGFVNLQQGMAGFEGLVTPQTFPADTLTGRLWLVGIGVAITLVTQSSSAGVATAIAAVGTGTVSFSQAAAMVIGMDVGTTVTAALATIGASLPARRTGWAHVVYNVLTGVGAFFLLPVYALVLERAAPGFAASDPEFALVGFHSLFNFLGVVIVLPFTGPFARLVERMIPERPVALAAGLDPRFLAEPTVALRAVGVVLSDIARLAFDVVSAQLPPRTPAAPELSEIREALDETQRYVARIRTPGPGGDVDAREVAALHVIDQLRRLIERCEERRLPDDMGDDPVLRESAGALAGLLGSIGADAEEPLARLEERLRQDRPAFRREILHRASVDELTNEEALERLDAYRWLERETHHANRIVHHLERIRQENPVVEAEEPPEPD
ncbi:MAG: Na/Pi cotransporter family protein [Myxococcota bacterium]